MFELNTRINSKSSKQSKICIWNRFTSIDKGLRILEQYIPVSKAVQGSTLNKSFQRFLIDNGRTSLEKVLQTLEASVFLPFLLDYLSNIFTDSLYTKKTKSDRISDRCYVVK